MNEAQVRALDQVRQVLAGTQDMQFQASAEDEGRYAWIEAVLMRFEYLSLLRADRGLVLAYLQRLSGYSRAQVARLVSRWDAGKPLVKNYGAPRHPFARLYTPADVALLVEVDRAMGTLSGPATACCCAASMTPLLMIESPGWARSRWVTCTTCATAPATIAIAWC